MHLPVVLKSVFFPPPSQQRLSLGSFNFRLFVPAGSPFLAPQHPVSHGFAFLHLIRFPLSFLALPSFITFPLRGSASAPVFASINRGATDAWCAYDMTVCCPCPLFKRYSPPFVRSMRPDFLYIIG